jgi:hypothetical protein
MESPSEVAAGGSESTDESDDSEESEEGDDTNVDATLGIISTGTTANDQPIDEGVTSGSDGVTGDPGGTPN